MIFTNKNFETLNPTLCRCHIKKKFLGYLPLEYNSFTDWICTLCTYYIEDAFNI